MALTRLDFDSIGELDEGAARAVINNAFNTEINDLDDRGDDGKPREVRTRLDEFA
jgi:hypothetical protein